MMTVLQIYYVVDVYEARLFYATPRYQAGIFWPQDISTFHHYIDWKIIPILTP